MIIQLLAILTANDAISLAAWLSLGASALSSGFISASISYDFDTDPTKRQENPSFYGYIPANAKKRTLVFISMLLMSALLLIARSLTIVLLGLSGKRTWTLAFILFDLGFYLLVKAVRGDYWYWMPAGGYFEILTSFYGRVMVKIIVDFTSIVQLRHPNEMGGLQWTFDLFLTLAGLPLAVWIYGTEGGQDSAKLTTVSYWLIPIIVACLALFFLTIDRQYLHTFVDLTRAKDLTIKKFRDCNSDEMKARAIFKKSRHHWESINEEIRGWIEANWNHWRSTKPEWWDDAMRARIPLDLLPTLAARKREMQERVSSSGFGLGTTWVRNRNALVAPTVDRGSSEILSSMT